MAPDSLQTLVISLPQSIDRQEKVKAELSKTKLQWQFLEAVDGRKLSYPIPEYQPHKVQRLLGFQLTPNEIGCFLSHRKAWEACVNQNRPTLVFEDDFVLLPFFKDMIQILHYHSPDWHLVRLQALIESSHQLVKDYGRFSLVKNDGDPLGATSYLLKPSAARLLLQSANAIYEPLDHYLEHYQKHALVMLATNPYLVDITKVASTIADRPSDRKPVKGFKKRLRSLCRQWDRLFSKSPWFPK
jgi:glycosyl transferase family 25